MNCAAHYRVDFHLYFGGAASNDQTRFPTTPAPRHINRESACSQAIGRVSDSSVDSGDCFLPFDSVIEEDQIQIDRESRHVPKKQIDRPAALQSELIVNEHQWLYLNQ